MENENTVFYTKESTLDFHNLLYFAFLMTGKALGRIKTSHIVLPSKDALERRPVKHELTIEEYKTAILAAELPIRFLLCMLSSTAFKVRMGVWTKGGLSLKPIRPYFEERHKYFAFGVAHGIRHRSAPLEDPFDCFDEDPKVGEQIR